MNSTYFFFFRNVPKKASQAISAIGHSVTFSHIIKILSRTYLGAIYLVGFLTLFYSYLKFASQLNSKHFLTGQKKSALTSLRFSRDATI